MQPLRSGIAGPDGTAARRPIRRVGQTHRPPGPRLDRLEGRTHVALLALPAVAAFMGVVLRVAADALRRRENAPFHGPAVTGAADRALVLAVEDEFRPRVVVEIPGLPAARVVALLAAGAQRLLVLVVLDVAGVAVALRAPEQRARVTHPALHLRVSAEQRKAGQAVVERRRRLPCLLVVALRACLAQLTFVLVVLAVAGTAVLRRLLVVRRLVAGAALGLLVLAQERKCRPGMVEARLLPVALVVALLAGLAQRAL